ncbi:hypothetical protein FCL47_10090 [Desulfopila sp. IMCC35006]|uniref:hypothetical protein n=1 Tax=Desulfopila sp. IMCC35006 TaxID=2569542 RepID=UPI0010AB591C|nr:hypothetical protein [Desulfopila sp. IMCC35006]TKB26087.1 hypothetical protein FCL47_10090 [Desulfopila sp. IMCC35006]
MEMKNLTHIFEGNSNGTPLDEIIFLAAKICPSIDLGLIREVDDDLTAIFSESFLHFPENTVRYHNLRHSQMVVLASARLFHGLHCKHIHVSSETLFKGLLAAYFHDTGMLPQERDQAHSDGQETVKHETRSILFLQKYVAQKGFTQEIFRDCATIIRYTDLDSDPATFDYHSHEIQLAGQVVGSADILAQMADRYYLECLPLLFDEQQAGGINRHDSARELMEHTEKFYHEVVLKRLSTTFSNTSQAMQTHFREMYKLDRNLYLENIHKNINYLKKIIAQCDSPDCLNQRLKRNPPTT